MLVHLDLTNGFGSISRDSVAAALEQALPGHEHIIQHWIKETVYHYWYDATAAAHCFSVDEGVDQGDPLAAGGFCAGLHHGVLRELLQRVREWGGELRGYLDDLFVRIPAAKYNELLAFATPLFAAHGLQLNAGKTTVLPYSDSAASALPGNAAAAVREAPVLLGAFLARAARDSDVAGGMVADRVKRFLQNLEALRGAGLQAQSALACLRGWLGGALTHMLRLRGETVAAMLPIHQAIKGFLEQLVGASLPDDQAFLPLRLGGAGITDVRVLAPAAFLGSVALTLSATMKPRGVHTDQALATKFPCLTGDVDAALGALAAAGAARLPTRQEMLGEARVGVQKVAYATAAEAASDRLLQSLRPDHRAWLRSCSGPGAGAWLQPPRSSKDCMADPVFVASLVLRLRATGDLGPYAIELGDTLGGEAVRRHDELRDVVAGWLTKVTPHAVRTEQYLAELRNRDRDGRMDVVAADAAGARILVDTAVTHPVSSDPQRLARAALHDGAAGAAAEGHKRDRYPRAVGLVPFVVETGGRVCPAARAMARRLAPTDPALRSKTLAGLWQSVAVTVQRHNALQWLWVHGH